MVMFAQMPRFFVRSGGHEYTKVRTSGDQHHPEALRDGRLAPINHCQQRQTTAYAIHVKTHGPGIFMRPLVSGRLGLLIRSISRS